MNRARLRPVTQVRDRVTREALPLRRRCRTSLLYSDAIHKLGMADHGRECLLCHAHPLPAYSGADLPKCCSPVRS